MDHDDLLRRFMVEPGNRLRLDDHDPAWCGEGEFGELRHDELKQRAREILAENVEALSKAQERLWADDRRAVLVVLQGMDTAGKDGLIKHLLTGVNPQGCDVVSFKQPSAEELDHTFLWRCMRRTPERGRIAIFNRSHYEDVLVVRVRPELLEAAKLPPGPRDAEFWARRYEDINAFERHLATNGTLVLKFFLNISREEQRRRLLARLEDPRKQWKFSAADLAERRRWDAYRDAYERAITATSTEWAPWHIVPADRKWVTRAVVSAVVAKAIGRLDLREPGLDAAAVERLREARRTLEAEAP
ncbi:MAG: PPK2 family polyphosphate kinase [Phycisphaerales bacterium]